MRKRCSRCGKKLHVLKDGTIGKHKARVMASRIRYMSHPELDDDVETVHCPGSWAPPHKGHWRGEIGWIQGAIIW